MKHYGTQQLRIMYHVIIKHYGIWRPDITYLHHTKEGKYCWLTVNPVTGLMIIFGAKLSLSTPLSGNSIERTHTKPPDISGYAARIAGISISQYSVQYFHTKLMLLTIVFISHQENKKSKQHFCTWNFKLYRKAQIKVFFYCRMSMAIIKLLLKLFNEVPFKMQYTLPKESQKLIFIHRKFEKSYMVTQTIRICERFCKFP